MQGHVADVHENRETVYEDQTKAKYKSSHSLFGKTKAKDPHNLGRAAYSTQKHQTSNQETPSPNLGQHIAPLHQGQIYI